MNTHHAHSAVSADQWVLTASGAMTMAIHDWKPWDVVKNYRPDDAKVYFRANIQQLDNLQIKIDEYKLLNTMCINDITRMKQYSESVQLYEHAVPSLLRYGSCDRF